MMRNQQSQEPQVLDAPQGISRRIWRFCKGGSKESLASLRDYHRENEGGAVLVCAWGAALSLTVPLAAPAIANFLVMRAARKREHLQALRDIREAHERGEDLSAYRTRINSFSAKGLADYYRRGCADERADRRLHSGILGAGGIIDLLTSGGIGTGLNAAFGAEEAIKRNRLIDDLQARKQDTPSAPGIGG